MFLVETGLPFDDVRRLIENMPKGNSEAQKNCNQHNLQLSKPVGSLGKLEDSVAWLALYRGLSKPKIVNPLIAVFVSGHGLATNFPDYVALLEKDKQNLDALQKGDAAINQLSRNANASLRVFELGLEVPTQDMLKSDALSEKECVATMAYGMESVAEGGDLLALGEFGMANTLVAGIVCCALFGGDITEWLPQEQSVSDEDYAYFVRLAKQALDTHKTVIESRDALEILRCLGGRDLSAMAGAILAARYQNIPVLLDSFATCTAATVLFVINPDSIDHCMASQVMPYAQHQHLLEKLGKQPLLSLGITLTEGCGSALAIPVLRAATVCHTGIGQSVQSYKQVVGEDA